MKYNEWKLPLNLAIGFHLLLVLAAIYMPGIFNRRPPHPDIYTVNLVNIVEPTVKKTQPKPKQETSHPKAIHAKPVISPKTTPVVSPKAVSLKPLKRKIEKDTAYDKLIQERLRRLKLQERRKQAFEKRKRLEQLRRQRLAESIKAEQSAEREAHRAAEELKKMLQASSSIKNSNADTQQNNQGSNTPGTNNNFSVIEKQYFASISNRIQQFWALPDLKQWDPSLMVVVWITINKDGSITSQHFENSSGDKFFDQYVEKTLRDAVPLPQIPAALNKSQIEIGLRFKPNGIQ